MPTQLPFPSAFSSKSGFVGAALLEMRIIPRSLRVHQIEIEITRAAGFIIMSTEQTAFEFILASTAAQFHKSGLYKRFFEV